MGRSEGPEPLPRPPVGRPPGSTYLFEAPLLVEKASHHRSEALARALLPDKGVVHGLLHGDIAR